MPYSSTSSSTSCPFESIIEQRAMQKVANRSRSKLAVSADDLIKKIKMWSKTSLSKRDATTKQGVELLRTTFKTRDGLFPTAPCLPTPKSNPDASFCCVSHNFYIRMRCIDFGTVQRKIAHTVKTIESSRRKTVESFKLQATKS